MSENANCVVICFCYLPFKAVLSACISKLSGTGREGKGASGLRPCQ